MTDHTPITGEELEVIKQRVDGWLKGGYMTPANLPGNLNAQLMIVVAADVLAHAPDDLARCLAEIERQRAENDALRNEAARIILMAEEETPSDDGLSTVNVKFTKELLDQLRSLVT